MRHISSCSGWTYSVQPFPAYRIQLDYGHRQKAFALLPVKGIHPVEGVLPDGEFRIVRTRKGTILAVSGGDASDRCLLMCCEDGGFRGGVSLVPEETTAEILLSAVAGNARYSRYAIAAILRPGEEIVFHSWGRGEDEFVLHEWDGKEAIRTIYQKEEWVALTDMRR